MKSSLLVITPRLPYPPLGGDRLRIYQLCRSLSREFDLSLLSLCESKDDMKLLIPDDGVFIRVERVFHSKWRRLLGCIKSLITREPLQVGYYWSPQFAEIFQRIVPSHDGVLAHLVRMGPYIEQSPKYKIMEMTDAISLSYIRAAKHVKSVRGLFYNWEAARLAKYEKKMIALCDLTVLVSGVDAGFLQSEGTTQKVIVCSNGVDTLALPFDYSPDCKTIVFIGKNTYRSNIDAILYFHKEIMPIVQNRCPDARFKIIGEISNDLRNRLESEGALVTGRVESIREATLGASVGVCPLRFGAGVQNKLLEYLALGIPAVTSPIGLEGLDAAPGQHLAVANSIEEWVDTICKLLEDPESGRRFAMAGRAFVEQSHSWESLLGGLKNVIRQFI